MKIKELVKKGPLEYTHYYMGGTEKADHMLEVPKTLVTIAEKYPNAEALQCGDYTLVISIGEKKKVWACEQPHEMRTERKGDPGVALPREVWQYLHLAMDTGLGDSNTP